MSVSIGSVVSEFEGADLGDRRLNRRLLAVAAACAGAPEKSFPRLTPTPAALRGTYRLVNNENVTPAAIIAPHVARSVERAREVGLAIVVHDTTQLEFDGEGEREGLGFIRSQSDQGFSLHCALGVAGDGSRRPLGVLAHRTWVRTERKRKRRTGYESIKDASRESLRWIEQIQETEARLGEVPAIHVADREADAFLHFREMIAHEHRFVVRMRQDRVLLDEHDERAGRVSEELVRAPLRVTVTVPVSRRAPRTIPTRHSRPERMATLEVKATRLRLKPPNYIPDEERLPIELNAVVAIEVDAPEDQEPISWILLTSEPVDTAEHVLFVLEAYRTRWLIEEYFKALKTGCAFEKRQLESFDGLDNALAIFLPIAWQLLLLRSLHRTEPLAPASLVLNPTQIAVLRAKLPKLVPAEPTVDHVIRAIAWLGGHFIKKPAGWQSLGWGFEELLGLEEGWRLAHEHRESCG